MATVNGTITSGSQSGESIQVALPAARVPELPELVIPIEGIDKIPIYDDSEGKTSWTPVSVLRSAILDGTSGSGTPPVIMGDMLEIPITSAMAGTRRVDVPSLANKTYKLYRRGFGYVKSTEYNVLSSGGWVLLDRDANGDAVPVGTGTEDKVQEGEVFFAQIYELQATTPSPTNTTTKVFTGIAPITVSTELRDAHRGKLIHVSGGSSAVTITLEDLLDAPDDSLVVIETMMGNTKQTTVSAKNTDEIFFNNNAYTQLHLGKGEFIWLLKGVDGWYVTNASQGLYDVGQVFLDYVQRPNSMPATGALFNRADFPRITQWLSSTPGAIVTEINWQTIGELRGKFSDGNGTTTARWPDHLDQNYFNAITGLTPYIKI